MKNHRVAKELYLHSLKFWLTFSFTLKEFTVFNEQLFGSLKGVYVIRYVNKQGKWITAYVGKYGEILYRRCINVGSNTRNILRHNKFDLFLDDSKYGVVFVYAASEELLAEQIPGPICNNAGVEEWLLRQDNYKFNIANNIPQAASRGSRGRQLRSK